MKATLRKYGILLATLLSVAFSFNYSNAQITGASTVCVNGSTTLVAPATTISGGTITNVSGYNVHTFTGAGTFVIPAGMNINTELLVVAGGGGGGKRHAGGGGAGGLIYSASYNTSGSQSVVIGAGGQGSVLEPNNGLNGGNSVFGSVVATGGGGGGTNNIVGNSGGSGGGGSNGSFGGAGIVGQGFAGGNQNNGLGCCYAMGNGGGGATGAGASTAGLAGSNGGPGFTTSMTGVSQSFAGGGGGGQGLNITTNYLGGIGGGGMGGNALNMQGANGTANTGGGGGGGGATDFTSGNGGNGGSGIVIVKYAQAGAGTWSSSNLAVATVNASTGAVTGVSAGSATITYTVTVGGVVNTFTKVITVNGLPVASIKPSGALAFCAGGNVTLSAATSALQFNGSNSVSVASGFAATDDITYEATVTPTSLSGFNVIMNHDNYNTGAIHYQFVNGQLQFSVAGNAPNDQYCSAAFAANTTYRVAAVYSKAGKYVKFYVNGVLINTASYSSTVSIIGNNGYKIGSWGGGRFFQGTIDDIRVWNVQRTDAQVLSDAAAMPIATGTANLIRYYRFDEGTGTTTSDDAGGATGTLVGSPVWVSTTPVGQTYLWSNGSTTSSISATTAGNYSVTVTSAAGCVSVSEAKTVAVNPLPTLVINNSSPSICAGASSTLSTQGNLVAYWKFNEGTGTTVADASGNNLNGTFAGTLGWSTAAPFTGAGTGLSDNAGGYVVVNDNPAFAAMQTAMTIEAWVYQTDNANNTIIDKSNYNFLVELNPNGQPGLGFYNPNDGWSYSTTSVPTNTWVHIALTWDAATKTLKFYKNGVLTDTFIRPNGLAFDNGSLNIGRQQPSSCQCNLMNGNIDELRLWSVVRTASEISANMNQNVQASSISSFVWSPSTGLNTTTGNTVIATPTGTTKYTVIATSASGCVATANTTVSINATTAASIVASGPTAFCANGSVVLKGAGAAGNALQLNGSNYAEIVNNNLPLGTAARTLEAWVKTTQTSGGAIANWGVISSGQRFGLLVISGKLYFVGQNVDMIGNITINDGVWHHVAVTYNGTTVTTYVDGVQDATGNLGLNTVGATLRIGQRSVGDNGNELFVGQIDEVRVWNIAKTITQIQATQKLSVATNSANLVAYYKMNEASGTTIADATSNAVTANLIGSPTFAASGADILYSTYTWSNNATTNSITVNATGNYSYSATTADGCSVSATATTVTVNPLPTATITGATNVCINTGSPLVTFTGANGTAPYTFTYSINAGAQQTVTSTGNIATVSAPTGVVGTFTYTLLSVKDASTTTCSNTITGSSIVVVVRAIPTISGITGATSICAGNSTTLNAASTFVGANYNWYDAATGGNLLASGATYATAVLSSTTNYYVELTAAPYVCAATRTLVTVTVTPNNTIALSSAAGTDAQTALINNAIANITYATTGATAVNVSGLPTGVSAVLTGNNLLISGTPTLTGTFNYTINLSGGCGNISKTGSITVNQAAAIANCPFTGYQQFFASATNCTAIATYSPTFTGFPAPQVSYTFTGATIASGVGTGSGSSFNVGTTTVTITATNSVNSSICSFDITVIDNNPPTVITKNITVYLDAQGQATITPSDVNNGSNDNCGTVSLSLENIGKICGTGNEGNNVTLTAPAGAIFTSINFASYGTPNGSCGNFSIGNCNASNSVSIVSPYLLGKNSGTIPALNSVFTDPCGGTVKRLYIQASYKGGSSATNSFNCSNLGSNTVNLIVTDAYGNASSATAIVTVADNIAPTIAAPSNISVNATSSLGAFVNYTAPVGTDNTTCVTTIRTAGLASGSRFPIGTTNVTYTSTDAAGNSTNATFTVTVSGLAPVIVKPADKVVASPANQCAANVSFAATETTGIPASTITYKENGATVISGALFSVGVHTITATATNAVGSSSTTFTITVNDVTAPTINTIADINVIATGANGALVNYSAPVGTDNCSAATTAMTAGLASGSTFPIGTTVVTYTVTDAAGLTASTSFNVTIVGVAPSIVKPADISVISPLGECGANVNFAATETVGIPASVITYTVDGSEVVSGANFSVGVHTITATATNSIGSTSVDFTITVIDDQLPTITAPADITINNTEGRCGAIDVALGSPTVADNCAVADYYPDYHYEFPVGTTDVTWTVVDASGNIATAIQHVTVIDNEKPFIRKAFDWGREGGTAEPGKCGTSNIASLHLGVPGTASTFTVSDNCEIASITSNAPTFFPVGVTIVTYTVTDIHGNFSTIDEEVTVSDFEPPVIAGVDNITVNATSANGAVVNYTAPVGTDNCSAATTVMTAGLESGATFPIGTTVVTYTVTDATGLTASTSFNVTVIGIVPSIVAPDNYLVNSEAGICGASVNFAATETTAIPASTITYTENGSAIVSGAYFTVGTHTITATATNAVGSSSVDFTITVVDHEIPTITAPTNVSVNADAGLCTASNVALGNAVTADNCSVATVTNNAPATFPVGTTTVTWTVTDSHGNIATATQDVVVTDNQLPTITAPANITVTANAGICSASNVALGNAVTADNCAVASVTNNAPTAFPVGTTTVTWTVTDIHGNVSTATQDVTVTDDELPVIVNTPINITQSNDQGNCGAVVTWTAATATDNCPGVTISSDHQSGETFPVGTTTVTYTATDAHAHTVTSSFTITVNDTELPTINTTDKTQTADAGVCKATVTVAAPVTADNCGVASVTNSINGTSNASGVYPVGTTQITWTVTDIHGNVNTTVQNITVNDEEKPVAIAQNLTIQLDANGAASITSAQINNGSTDNCGIASITLDKTSFYCSNVGANIVTLTVTDIHGNVSTATATVTVQDKVAPIAKAKNITVGLGTQVGGLVTISAAQVDNGSTDACGIASMTVVPASFGCSKVGANTVTLTVTDVNGNSSTTTAVVTIVDDKGPVPTVTTLPTITGQCYATVLTLKPGEKHEDHEGDDDDHDNRIEMDHYYLVVPTAMDNCSGLAKGTTTDPLTYYNQGTYIIHWKYVDAKGNVTIQEQTVIVKDTQAPTPKRATLPTITGQCSVSIATSGHDQGHDDEDEYEGDDNDHHDGDNDHNHWNQHHSGAPWAKDNCSGWIKGTTTDPLTYSVQGTYIIHWNFDDGHGNVSTQTQTVIVKDVNAPRAVQNNLPTITGQCSATVTTAPTAMDNCVGLVTGTTTDALTYNAPGTYSIHWTYSDGRGNTSTQNQQVVVRDNIKPVLSLPANVTGLCVGMSTDPSATGTATATDNCSATITVTYTDQKSGSSINRTWKATDASGNTATAVQQISFSAAYTASIVSVPTSNVNTGASSTSLFLGYGAQSTALTVTGLPSSGAPYTYQWTGIALNKLNSTTAAAPVFTPTAAGNYQFTVTVTNKNGCTANASINICVKDIRVPSSNGTKVYVCHTGNGKSSTTQTLEVLISQVASHINGNCGSRGNDVLGSCNQGTCDPVAPVVNAVDQKTQDVVEMKTMKSDVTAAPVEDLKVVVMPNPSTTYFTLKFETKDQKTPLSLRVMDASGRAIDSKQQIEPSNTIQIGHNYPSGTFFAEVIQGNKRKVVQLIKARG